MTDHHDAAVERLRRRLSACRLAYANLLAAVYATLRAANRGDPYALWFLRNELPASHPLAKTPADGRDARGKGGCR